MTLRFGWRSGTAAPAAALALASCLMAQSFLNELEAVRSPGKRSEKALVFADTAFDHAQKFYENGQIQKGNAALDQMTQALATCLKSAEVANKAKYFKKAELNVANLQRRMTWLLSDLDVRDRGWAKTASKKMDEIHDKLLAGVMRK